MGEQTTMLDRYNNLQDLSSNSEKEKIGLDFIEVELLKIVLKKNQEEKISKKIRLDLGALKMIRNYDSTRNLFLKRESIKSILNIFSHENNDFLAKIDIPDQKHLDTLRYHIKNINPSVISLYSGWSNRDRILSLFIFKEYFDELTIEKVIQKKYECLNTDKKNELIAIIIELFEYKFKDVEELVDAGDDVIDYYQIKTFLKTIDINIPVY